jgi:uncharacterized protein (TIGR00303 family)
LFKDTFIRTYTQPQRAAAWFHRHQGQRPLFACILGFTETGLIPGISAAGATPRDRQFTALADAEFLANGPAGNPCYPLPPLHAGASPVLISRAIIEACRLPVHIFNAGLPHPPSVPTIDLQGAPAGCLSTGNAMPMELVQHLLQQGLDWGKKLAIAHPPSYILLSECVVGGTSTALALLTALGINAANKVNSSHPVCNHAQKQALVQQGLDNARCHNPNLHPHSDPLGWAAAVGDPMQIVVAGMAIAISRQTGVLLAGGTQMLAVYALARRLAQHHQLPWQPEQIIVGTTRWVAEDPTGNTVELAEQIGEVALCATPLSFASSRFAQLQAYERGYVKEGVGAGGSAISASLAQNWGQPELLQAIEAIAQRHQSTRQQA